MDALLAFVKNLLGFYGDGQDTLLTPLILSAERYLKNAGVKAPPDAPVAPEEPGEEATPEETEAYETALAIYTLAKAEYDKEVSPYNLAVAVRVKIIHDGDPKGDFERTLTGIILQIKDYAGGEVI